MEPTAKKDDYLKLYQEVAEAAEMVWADTERPSYEADVWYNRNRNEISLAMMRDGDGGTLCKGKRVLAIGAQEWVEREFLEALNDAASIVRTDIVGNAANGIIHAEAQHLPFKDGAFGVVIAREIIEHVPDSRPVFSEIRRVLEADGLLLITTPNAYNFEPDGCLHLIGYTPLGFLEPIKQWGFDIVDKRGNVPNIFQGAGPLSQGGYTPPPGVLAEFKELAAVFEAWPNSYYFGTQLFVLAQKASVEG